MAESHMEEIEDLENKLEELRRKFDLYFQGDPNQRRPPLQEYTAFSGTIRRKREEGARWNTSERFRMQTLSQRVVSYDRMWQRTLQAIEDGTHKRDKFKVQQAKKRDLQEGTKQKNAETHLPRKHDSMDAVDVDMDFNDPSRSQPVPRPVAAKPVPAPVRTPSSNSDGGMNEARIRQLYDVYMQAKKRTGEKSSLTLDALRDQITKQVPAIKAKHRCEQVDFKVVLKDGKAMLKAIPK